MKKTLVLLFFWLLLVNTVALLVSNRFNLKQDTAYAWMDSLNIIHKQSWNPIALHARWDSLFYIDIARNGYYLPSDNTPPNVVFFPLYPFLIFVVAAFTGGDVLLAGWLVSILALAGAVVVFYKLLREFHPTIDPEKPILYLLIFPTAFFFNTVYTESLYLLLSLLTFYYALKGRFASAGIVGLLAALTRVTGVLLFIPIVWEFLRQRGPRNIVSLSFLPLFLHSPRNASLSFLSLCGLRRFLSLLQGPGGMGSCVSTQRGSFLAALSSGRSESFP